MCSKVLRFAGAEGDRSQAEAAVLLLASLGPKRGALSCDIARADTSTVSLGHWPGLCLGPRVTQRSPGVQAGLDTETPSC